MLIVLEGIDGTGKTSVAAELARSARAAGHSVVATREPSDSPAGRQLRALLRQAARTSTPQEELELFHADREHHVKHVVEPALKANQWVIQDRTFYSTAAYQGALGLSVDAIVADSRRIAPEPDLVLLLWLEPAAALERIRQNRETLDNFEQLEYLEKVAAIYRRLAEQNPNFVSVDASQPLAHVVTDCLRQLHAYPQWSSTDHADSTPEG